MTREITICAIASIIILSLTGCNTTKSQLASIMVSPTAPSIPVIGNTPTPTLVLTTQDCPDLMAVIKAFYNLNDASQFNESLALLTDEATSLSSLN